MAKKLIRQVALHDPRLNYSIRSPSSLFNMVPKRKSLLRATNGKGIPIGNLTSQFFANIYLNELDQYVKHVLKVRYYGRYVDDVVLFSKDPGILNQWYEDMNLFLQNRLGLSFHPNKKHINLASQGIDFTGFIIKPGRTYLRQSSLDNCKRTIRQWEKEGSKVNPDTLDDLSKSVNSYLGMLRHVNGYKARKSICKRIEKLFLQTDKDCTKVTPLS